MKRIGFIITPILAAAAGAMLYRLASNSAMEPEPKPTTTASSNLGVPMPITTSGTGTKPVSAGGMQAQAQDREKQLLEFLNQSGAGTWIAQRNESGRLVSLSGGKISGVGKSSLSAFNFVQELAPLLGVGASQISKMDAGTHESVTARSKIFRFGQKVGEFTVYGSGMTVMTSRSDGSVFLITTDLKEVTDFKSVPHYSAEDVRKLVSKEFEKNLGKILRVDAQPVLWADSRPSELAWIFVVQTLRPDPAIYRVLVGADSKKILFKQKTSRH